MSSFGPRLVRSFAMLWVGLLLIPSASTTATPPSRLTFEVEGAGPDVVLIPGLASPRSVWDKLAPQLRDRFRLHLVQVRGFGPEPGDDARPPVPPPDAGGLVADLTSELAAHLDREGLSDVSVIGHSIGGVLATQLALNHPDRVARVLTVDSLPFTGLLFGLHATAEALRPQADAIRRLPQLAAPSDDGALQRQSNTADGRAAIGRWLRAADAPTVNALFADALVTDLRPRLPRLTRPVTVLYPHDGSQGSKAQVDAFYDAAWAGAPDLALERIDGSRHFIMLDAPDALAHAVERWLAERP